MKTKKKNMYLHKIPKGRKVRLITCCVYPINVLHMVVNGHIKIPGQDLYIVSGILHGLFHICNNMKLLKNPYEQVALI